MLEFHERKALVLRYDIFECLIGYVGGLDLLGKLSILEYKLGKYEKQSCLQESTW